MSDLLETDLRFSIIPEWVLDRDISDRAIRIYALISRYADNDTLQAFPSRETLATRAKCSVRSVDRAVEELISAGALTKKHRKTGEAYQSNLYTVKRVPRGVATGVSLGGDTGDTRVATGVSLGGDTGGDLTITTELEPKNLKPKNYIKGFDDFWQLYPKKVDKRLALRSFEKALKRAKLDVILNGAKQYRDDPGREDRYTKNPSTWLNADAWDNEPLSRKLSNAEKAAKLAVELATRAPDKPRELPTGLGSDWVKGVDNVD